MKTCQIYFVLLLLAFNTNASSLSTFEQLKQINANWVHYSSAVKITDAKFRFVSDRELIQFHLQLVEQTLRAKTLPTLDRYQKKQRLQLLDALHDYWVKGRFPKNTRHLVRTPYFIDAYGTACAVGQLIIKSGYAAVAEQISRENNNAYISELVRKYPQIKDWANQHGFTIEELAWIQPCYQAPPDTLGLRHPTCHNATNGYFCPDFNQLQGPLTKSLYRLESTGWVSWINMCGQPMFSYCKAGKYKWVVTDNLNTTHTFSVELVAPAPATVTIIKSGNFNTCNGVITVSAQGGVLPYGYFWAGHTATTSVLTSVCEESVHLSFYEVGYSFCPQFFQIETGAVGLQENNIDAFRISPNPVTDILQLRFDPLLRAEYKIAKVLNVQGQIVLETDLRNEPANITLSQLPPGLYFLQVDNYKVHRFLKE